MASDKEVEIKFRIDNLREVTRRLRRNGFRLLTQRTHEMNTLYDFPDKRLRRSGQLLRLRKYGSEWLLTHKAKGRAGRHKTRIETQTKVDSGQKMENILRSLGFKPVFRYEKFRSEWSDDKGYVVLDQTPIGNFGEIEGQPRWIDAVAKQLGIGRENYITQTYADLFFQWKQRTGKSTQDMTFQAVRNAE